MSSVMRPSGPLPARVYWVRRLLLLVVLFLVATLVWWVVERGDAGAQPAASGDADPSGPSAPAVQTSTAATTPAAPDRRDPGEATQTRPTQPRASDHPGRHRPGRNRPGEQHEQRPTKPERTPLARPTGPCDPTRVDVAITVDDTRAGRTTPATLKLTSTDTPACTLAITPDVLVARVSSGDDVLWSSSQCPDDLPARKVVVRHDPPSTYSFTWDGRRSGEDCRPVAGKPEPGGYWVEAAFVGGEPHKAFFDIR